jgi:quercetin dioxygenase-like cupin family protein
MEAMARVSYSDLPALSTSQLALRVLDLDALAHQVIEPSDDDTVVYTVRGQGTWELERASATLSAGAAALAPCGEEAELIAGEVGLKALVFSIGPAVDHHAAMGPRDVISRLDGVAHAEATGNRSFQILFDGANGSTRATLFAGHIPPGRAPWHYHLYDEIVCVLGGTGRLHIDAETEELREGSAFRLAPREVHIVENSSRDDVLTVLGLFTPAGSPSAAYLPAGVPVYLTTEAG